MQLQPVHRSGTPGRLAALAIGVLACAIVGVGWFGSHVAKPLSGDEWAAASAASPPEAASPSAVALGGEAASPSAVALGGGISLEPCPSPTDAPAGSLAFTRPLPGTDIRVAGPVRVTGRGATPGATLLITSSDGPAVLAPTDRLGGFSAAIRFLAPTGPRAVRVVALDRARDAGVAAACRTQLGSVAFTLLPRADVSVWTPDGRDRLGPPFVVSGATAGAIDEVRIRLEAPDGSLIDERTTPTIQVADGDHAFRSPPLAVERSDFGRAILIITWIDPRTGTQAPELVQPVTLAPGPD